MVTNSMFKMKPKGEKNKVARGPGEKDVIIWLPSLEMFTKPLINQIQGLEP